MRHLIDIEIARLQYFSYTLIRDVIDLEMDNVSVFVIKQKSHPPNTNTPYSNENYSRILQVFIIRGAGVWC